jgi:encore-like protein
VDDPSCEREQPKRLLVRNKDGSFERSPDRLSDKKSKSFEEREEEYEKVRKRIFNEYTASSQEAEG